MLDRVGRCSTYANGAGGIIPFRGRGAACNGRRHVSTSRLIETFNERGDALPRLRRRAVQRRDVAAHGGRPRGASPPCVPRLRFDRLAPLPRQLSCAHARGIFGERGLDVAEQRDSRWARTTTGRMPDTRRYRRARVVVVRARLTMTPPRIGEGTSAKLDRP